LNIEELKRENISLRKENLLMRDRLSSQKVRHGRPLGSIKNAKKISEGDKQVRVPIPLLPTIRLIIKEWKSERRMEIAESKELTD
jgi:hypothetical protein